MMEWGKLWKFRKKLYIIAAIFLIIFNVVVITNFSNKIEGLHKSNVILKKSPEMIFCEEQCFPQKLDRAWKSNLAQTIRCDCKTNTSKVYNKIYFDLNTSEEITPEEFSKRTNASNLP